MKQRWPDAHLRWLINPEWAPLLEGNPHVNEVVIFPRGEFRGLSGFARIPAWAKRTAQHKADLVLDFQGLLRSACIARLCRGGEVVGLSDAREGAGIFYDQTADVRGVPHAVDRYLRLAGTLGIVTAPPLGWLLPAGTVPVGFRDDEPYVLLHPFSRGAGKSLSVEDVAAFCRALAPRRVVIVGRADTSVPSQPNVTDLLNRTTLHELIWLLRRAAFVVSVDSGPMHIAAALTPRLVAIHTWSDPLKVGPYQPEAWVWRSQILTQMRDLDQAARHRACPSLTALAAFVAER